MAIVKLGDICKINSGKKPNKDLHKYITDNKEDGVNWLKQKDLQSFKLTKTNSFFKKEYLKLTKYTDGSNIYFFPDCDIKFFESDIDFCFDGHTWEIIPDQKIVIKKYFLYKMIGEIEKLKILQSGTTLKFITKDIFINYKINIPSLEKQQAIIDIIEPFEKKMDSFNKKLKMLNCLEMKLLKNSVETGKMINNGIVFSKGKNIDSKCLAAEETKIPFINVSAINNRINKWVNNDMEININYGDVVLSLDGTIGLVNNFLFGYNGYGYKVHSDNIQNFQIYYSLLHSKNKKIISDCAKGSVILHASEAKNQILLFDFKNNNLLEKMYKLNIMYKKNIRILKEIISKLIILIC